MIVFSFLSFLVLTVFTSTVVISSKLLLDKTWWHYICNTMQRNINHQKYLSNYDTKLDRCSSLDNASAAAGINATVHDMLEDRMFYLLRVSTISYSVASGIFLFTTCMQLMRSIVRTSNSVNNSGDSNSRFQKNLSIKRILLDALIGLLHLCLIITSIIPIIYVYLLYWPLRLFYTGGWIFNLLQCSSATSLTLYYIYICYYGISKKKTGSSNSTSVCNSCMGTCLGTCLATVFGKLFCIIISLGTLVLIGYLIYRHGWNTVKTHIFQCTK